MVTRICSVLLLGFILLAGSTPASAQSPSEFMGALKNRLGLTSQQVEKIRELQRAHRANVFPIQEQMQAKNQALRSALGSSEPNAAAVGQIVIEQHSLRKQLQALNEKLQTDILALLTPEQKQKLEQLGLFSLRDISRRNRR